MMKWETSTSTFEYVIAVGQFYVLTKDSKIFLVECIDEAVRFSSFIDCEQIAKDVDGQIIEIKTTIYRIRKI